MINVTETVQGWVVVNDLRDVLEDPLDLRHNLEAVVI